jgi:hypothetical protein
MSDTQETSMPVAEKATKKVSERSVLDIVGKVQDEWVDAFGFSYKSIAENFTLAVMFEDLPDPVVRALAAFGGLTLAGNTTNTVRNPGEGKVSDSTEKDALIAWLDNLKAGNWTSPRGEVEAGVTSLAEAYVAAMALAGKILDITETTAKLKAADKEKRAAIRKDPRVKAELTRIIAERASKKATEAAGDIMEL